MSGDSAVFGVIGGTGVYQFEGLENVRTVKVDTPFGPPSSDITLGEMAGLKCAFLARHGPGHKFTPTEVPFRANIFAMKKLGVKYLMAVSACGSLREEMRPLDLVLVDQFIDKTFMRNPTFYGDGVVVHVQFGDPTCRKLADLIGEAIAESLPHTKVHPKGTYVTMEGPAFSTKAESNLHRQWGADLIGMTAVTEAKLAREAEIAYSVVGLVTDYDCWHEEEADVSSDSVLAILKKNGNNVQIFTAEVIKKLAKNQFESHCHSSLTNALLTQIKDIPEQRKKDLQPLIGRFY